MVKTKNKPTKVERGVVELFCKVSTYDPKQYNMLNEEDIEVRSFLTTEGNNKEYKLYVNGELRETHKSVSTANQSAIELIQKRRNSGWVILSRSDNVRKIIPE